MKVIRELFAGAIDGNGSGSRKTEAAVGGIGAMLVYPEAAWQIAAVVSAFLIARGIHDVAIERNKQ